MTLPSQSPRSGSPTSSGARNAQNMRSLFIAVAAIGLGGMAVATTLWWGSNAAKPSPSLAAITAVVALAAAVQTAAVAIVGEYVVRGYREAQGRPTWVVRRTIGPSRAATRPTSKAA